MAFVVLAAGVRAEAPVDIPGKGLAAVLAVFIVGRGRVLLR